MIHCMRNDISKSTKCRKNLLINDLVINEKVNENVFQLQNDAIRSSVTTLLREIGAIERDVSRLCCCLVSFYMDRWDHFPLHSRLGIYRLPFARFSTLNTYGEWNLKTLDRYKTRSNQCLYTPR